MARKRFVTYMRGPEEGGIAPHVRVLTARSRWYTEKPYEALVLQGWLGDAPAANDLPYWNDVASVRGNRLGATHQRAVQQVESAGYRQVKTVASRLS